MRPVLLLLLACGWLPSLVAERGQPLVRNFLPRDYRAHEQIWQITDTPDGRLYFGNLNRVLEYDGQTWRSIPVPGGSYIRGLATDAAGTVWVAGINELGRLVRGPDGQLLYESLRDRVPDGLPDDLGTFWCLHVLPDGIYFQSSRCVLRWADGAFTVWPIPEIEVTLSYPYKDTLLVARPSGWYLTRPEGRWEQVGKPYPTSGLPRFLLPAPEGGWLAIASNTRLIQFHNLEAPVDRPTDLAGWIAQARIYGGRRLPDGRYLFHSIGRGAVIAAPDLSFETLLDENTGLATSTVLSSHLDRNGVLWLGTDNGVSRVELASPVTAFTQSNGLGRMTPEAIARRNGRLIASGDAGMIELRPPATVPGAARFHHTLDSDRFTRFYLLPDGMLACGFSGLFWISGDQATKLTGPAGVRDLMALPGQPGRFVATHLNGLASWRRDGAEWTFEGRWTEVTGEVRGFALDPAGALWLSPPADGVLRVEPAPDRAGATTVRQLGEAQGLPGGRARVWVEMAGGRPLFLTRGGLHRYDEATDRFFPETSYGARFVDGSTIVRMTVEDDAGGLWLATVDENGLAAQLFHAAAGQVRQLPMPDIRGLGPLTFIKWERHEGRELLWIGGRYQLRQVDLARWREAPPPPPGTTLVRTVSAGRDRPITAAGQPLRLAAGDSTIRFAFAAPGLGGEPAAQYETRLWGFADGGPELGALTERTFTNLPPGNYVFEARGRSADGRWSQPAQVAFEVLSPWRLTPWGLVIQVAAGGLLLAGYIRLRIRRLTRERNRLEAIVAERTAELAGRNAELARLHELDEDEKLAARLAEEKAQLELLRYQLNPHFLYNSLNSIRALVFADAAAAGEMVTRLSEFCRATLTRGTDGMTTVAAELELLQAYLDIERTRWQAGLRIAVEADPAALEAPLPQFLFLPLVENAIKYGGRTSPDILEVRVSVRLDGDLLVCEVANTGTWVQIAAQPRESTRIGLDNLRRRLARHYGPATEPEITAAEGWVRVRLRLPRHPPSIPPRTNGSPPP